MIEGIIYIVTDATNGKSYIGQTIKSLERRRSQHESIRNKHHPFYNALQLRKNSFLWKILVERCSYNTQEEFDDVEDNLIESYNTLWPNGYNMRNGGSGGAQSYETRRKISESHKGKKISEEHRENLRKSHIGKFASESTKAKMNASHKNLSDETRKKLSDAAKNISSDIRKKMADAHKGFKHSEESKKKIGDARRGSKHYSFGKELSDEHKRKLSEANKKAWKEKKEALKDD